MTLLVVLNFSVGGAIPPPPRRYIRLRQENLCGHSRPSQPPYRPYNSHGTEIHLPTTTDAQPSRGTSWKVDFLFLTPARGARPKNTK